LLVANCRAPEFARFGILVSVACYTVMFACFAVLIQFSSIMALSEIYRDLKELSAVSHISMNWTSVGEPSSAVVEKPAGEAGLSFVM